MDTVNLNTPSDGCQDQAAGCPVGSEAHLLEGIRRLSRAWAERLAVHEPQRANLIRIEILAEHLLRGDASASAMPYVRVLLCITCRRLNAVQGRCFGKSLDRCLLLKETGS